MHTSDRRGQRTNQFAAGSKFATAVAMNEDRLDYLRPNRYFRFYLFREKHTDITCWLPEGFLA